MHSSLYRTMSGVGAMTGGTGTSTGYSLPYMTNSPTELTASPQQLWTTQGLATSLPAISEDYCSSKSTATVTHQTLPAFSQPFGSRPPFRGYSPPYSSQQTGAGTGSGAADAGNATSWTYTSADALASPYGTVGTTSRRQASNTPTTPSQPQLSAAATLTANFTSNDDNTTHDGN